MFNDLWEFNPATKQWAWMSGSNTEPCSVSNAQQGCIAYGVPPSYGTLGVPSSTDVPGSRQYPAGWTDNSGALWMFGGTGVDSVGNMLPLNDLWKYQP
jgi:hypothetical protein